MNLDTVLQRADVWRGGRLSATADAVASGFAELDTVLPGGGWSRGALTEILMPQHGIGALRLLVPALARLSRDERWICWVAPPYIPYAPALVGAGEGSPLVPEQLAFKQRFRDGRAIDRDQALVTPVAEVVQRPDQHLFAGTALTLN